MKNIAVLGATGSIGVNTLDVIEKFPGEFRVCALTANSNIDLLEKQIRKFHPRLAAVRDEKKAEILRRRLGKGGPRVLAGVGGLTAAATAPGADVVVAATSGTVSLVPVLEALGRRKTIALANKETMVTAGELVTARARRCGAKIIPVDSELSAVFQCLRGRDPRDVKRVILTASGGPFWRLSGARLAAVTPGQALNHPAWKMGRKITVDSATMMNKGLEVIETHWLFSVPYEKIEVVIHPEAVIHSMVEFIDGSIMAQLAITDMRIPIQYALSYPRRLRTALASVDFHRLRKLTFRRPDEKKFPCLRLAYEAGRRGGLVPAAMNAANEEAVKLFLRRKVKFNDIARIVREAMENCPAPGGPSLEKILDAERRAREEVKKICSRNR